MADASGGARFAPEALAHGGVEQLGVDDFQLDLPLEPFVEGFVDDPPTATSQRTDDAVLREPIGERLPHRAKCRAISIRRRWPVPQTCDARHRGLDSVFACWPLCDPSPHRSVAARSRWSYGSPI